MTAPAEQATTAVVLIVDGRFAEERARLLGAGSEWATVDLGRPVDGGSGVVLVPVSAVREVEQ